MYLEKHDMPKLYEQVQAFTSIDQLQEFLLVHGENIVDMMGDEIDRIESKLSVSHKIFHQSVVPLCGLIYTNIEYPQLTRFSAPLSFSLVGRQSSRKCVTLTWN